MRLEQLQICWLDAEDPGWDIKLVINQLTDEAYYNSYFESTCIKLNTVTLPTASGNTNPWHPDSEEGKEDKSMTFRFGE